MADVGNLSRGDEIDRRPAQIGGIGTPAAGSKARRGQGVGTVTFACRKHLKDAAHRSKVFVGSLREGAIPLGRALRQIKRNCIEFAKAPFGGRWHCGQKKRLFAHSSGDRVALVKRGAAITLNGIAQGYATDRVVERLRGAGLSATLVNIGEIRAIGARPDGTPWRVGLADPDRPGVLTETVDLVDRAVATSAGAGFRFDPKGRFTHPLDPATGRSPSLYRTVSVIAPTATEADALSTAFSSMPLSRIEHIVAVRPNLQARFVEADGTLIVRGA
jgi:hypothetical protein